MKNINRLLLCVTLLFTMVLYGIFIPANIRAFSNEESVNSVYIKIMNFNLPVIESSKNVKNYGHRGIKEYILEFIGLGKSFPSSILKREISYFKESETTKVNLEIPYETEEPSENKSGPIAINPFEIEEDSLSKGGSNTDSDFNRDTTVSNVYNPDIRNEERPLKPQVLIYHTHTSEGYKPKGIYTDDNEYNVVAVGNEITRILEEVYNIHVIHNVTVHDSTRSDAYSKSEITLSEYLDKYGEFNLIIDLHRDAVSDKKLVTTRINGEDISKFMFVAAVENPHYSENKKVIDKFLEISERLYPGFSRGKGIYTYDKGSNKYYNQLLSNNAVLMEIGAESSEINEAKNSAKYLSRIIAEYLNSGIK